MGLEHHLPQPYSQVGVGVVVTTQLVLDVVLDAVGVVVGEDVVDRDVVGLVVVDEVVVDCEVVGVVEDEGDVDWEVVAVVVVDEDADCDVVGVTMVDRDVGNCEVVVSKLVLGVVEVVSNVELSELVD